jgi:phage-related minor tail protein
MLNSRATYSLSALISDASTGQFSRSRREVAALANETGLLSKVMTPTGLAIGSVVLALGAYTVASLRAEEQTQDFNKALLATGTYIEGGGKALSGTAAQVGVLTGQYSAATEAVMTLTKAGLGGATNLQQLSTAITNVATITGQSVDKISKSFIDLQKDPLGAISKTTEFMGLLTTAQYKEIAALQDTQGPAAAAALAIKDIGEQADQATKKLDDNAGAVLQFLDSAKSFGSRALFLIGHVGSNDIGTQIAVLQAQRKNLQDTLSSSAADWLPGYAAVIKKSISQVDDQIAGLQKKL